MALIFGSVLGYSGSEPDSSHCPDCGDCNQPIYHCKDSDMCGPNSVYAFCRCLCMTCCPPACTEPEEHERCPRHAAERRQEEGEARMEHFREGDY